MNSSGEISLNVPSELKLLDSLWFWRLIESAKSAEASKVVVDCSRLRWAEPFGMLILARALRQLAIKFPDRLFYEGVEDCQSSSYLSHVGFWKSCFLDYGNTPGQARGGAHYLPITRETIDWSEIGTAQGKVGKAFEMSEKLSGLLVGKADANLFSTVKYAFREIVRNVFEHSQAKTVWYAAQYWPAKGRVEIAIMDTGIGIRKSLAPGLSSDNEAIRLSLGPGVTKPQRSRLPEDLSADWSTQTYGLDPEAFSNSGFGLYVLSELARQSGSLFIGSGVSAVFVQPSGERNFDIGHTGTVIRLVLHPGEMGASLEKILQRKIVQDARGSSPSPSLRVGT